MQAWMWRLTEDHAVLYTNDRPTLNAVLAYGKFPHKDLSRATVYSSRNGRACGWQFTFPQTIWNGVVRHLGRSGITMLDHEPGRVAPRRIVASAPADLPVPAPGGTVGQVGRGRAKPGSAAPVPRTPQEVVPHPAPPVPAGPPLRRQGAADAAAAPPPAPPSVDRPEKQSAAPTPQPSASASVPLARAKPAGRARRTSAASEATPAPLAAANSSPESVPPGTPPPKPDAGVRPASHVAPDLVGAAGAATPRSPRTVRRGKK